MTTQFMEKALYKIFLFAALVLVWSCEEESNMEPTGGWDLSAPVLQTPAASAAIVLDKADPTEPVVFEWQAAEASNRFGVAYKVYLVDAASNGTGNPILVLTPGNSGKDVTVSATAEEIDYALWAKCYPAGATVNVKWVVDAKAIETVSTASSTLSLKRFTTERTVEQLFITGSGTEAGADAANATPMRALKNSDGDLTGVFDVYTTLTAGSTYQFRDQASTNSRVYGGSDGTLAPCGAAIAATETAVYRVTVNLNDNSYELWKVDMWSLVGDAIEGGWGGDIPLAYKGNGTWEGRVDFLAAEAGWIFRANGDWGYIMKRIVGTVSAGGYSGNVVMESEGWETGVEFEDLSISDSGPFIVTLNLASDQYNFNIAAAPIDPSTNVAIIGKASNPNSDQVQGNFIFGDYDVPAELYLVSDGTMVAQLTKDGNTFTSTWLALEQSKTYILNSASDGSGETYNNIGDGSMTVDHDQAYKLTADFDKGKLSWKHYNLKLFHWDDDVAGGWDARTETLLTYVHPYKFQTTGIALTAGNESKVFSPWEVLFGSSDTGLSGTWVQDGPNYKGISQSGNYDLSLTITNADDYTTADFTFVKK
jgi:starch-binding outer membrane protein SusE/F